MAVKIGAFRGTSPTSTGNKDFTNTNAFGGDTPACAIIFGTGCITTDTPDSDGRFFVGFTDGTDERTMSVWSEDAQATSDTSRYSSTTRAVMQQNSASTFLLLGDASFIADGIRINFSTVDASNGRFLSGLMFGGDDLSNSAVGNFTSSSSGVDVDLGWVPDIVFVAGTGNSSTSSAQAIFHFGVCHLKGGATYDEAGISFYDETSQATTDVGLRITDATLGGQYFNGSVTWDANITEYSGGTTGFTHTATAASGNDIVTYLALKFSNSPTIKLSNFDVPTSGGIAVTDVGGTPVGGLCIFGEATAYNTGTAADGVIAATVFDDTGSNDCFTENMMSEDANATASNADSESLAGVALRNASGDLFKGTFDGVDSAGFDFTLSANPGTALKAWSISICDVAAGGATPFGYRPLLGLNVGA